MSINCCPSTSDEASARNKTYRRILWVALIINIIMFAIEMVAGIGAESVALQADALDFLGDAGNYAISLFVLGMALKFRARASIIKGLTMGLFGLWVTGNTIWFFISGSFPDPSTMGAIGVLALFANVVVLALLWKYRTGDSNMRSVWICSRNDVIGNCAVLLAAMGVFGIGTAWPDLVVAAIMASLALHGAFIIIRQALNEV